jgi:hypothetical protein
MCHRVPSNFNWSLLDSASYSVVPAVFLKIRVVALQAMEVYGGVSIQLRSFLNLALDGLRDQLYTSSAVPATKDPSLTTSKQAGWDPGSVCTFQKKRKCLASGGNRKPDGPIRSLVTTQTTIFRLPQFLLLI